MADVKNLLLATAGAAGGAPLDVDEVFSTDLWTGDATNTTTITNGIDLVNEGGLVWFKARDSAVAHALFDTARGDDTDLQSNSTAANGSLQMDVLNGNGGFTTFKDNGFGVRTSSGGINGNGTDLVAWTFRKAPKFFDVITYSGNSTAGRTISHNLGCAVGSVWVKRTSHTNNWICWHNSLANTKYIQLNSNSEAFDDSGIFWNSTTPSSTTVTLGADSGVNATGSTYVMYVFAHNNNDGGFGPDSDQDIIKCGSYTGDGQQEGPNINLGFEPQWLLFKCSSHGEDWYIVDNMRGWTLDGKADYLRPRLTSTESEFDGSSSGVRLNSTGFQMSNNSNDNNGNGKEYLYIAIRRGPLAVPENASDVFAIDFDDGATAPAYVSGFVTDMGIQTSTSGYNKRASTRLTTGKYVELDGAGVEESSTSNYTWDFMNGWNNQSINTTFFSWMWKRAPGYFDVVGYKGDDQANRTVNHNLGVIPEMLWIRCRSDGQSTIVDHKNLSANKEIYLNATTPETTSDTFGTHTATQIKFVDGTEPKTNSNNQTYIAYLFATLAGVSKVGSYTGNGTNQNIECGFSSGAKFVLTKNIDNSVGNWSVWDTARGLTASPNSYWIRLNGTNAHNNSYDWLEPYSGGFKVLYGGNDNSPNNNGEKYIFYAVAA